MALQPLTLEIQTGKHKGRRVRLMDAELIVGRGEEARIRIASAEVSREHCKLVPMDDRVLVIDLKSRNGTFVDGRPVNGQKMLTPGGSLTVGPLTFLLIGDDDESSGHSARVVLKGKVAAADNLSDDEIASWLSDSELPATKPDDPTATSITKHALPVTAPPPAPAAAQTPEPPPSALLSGWQAPAPKPRGFRTVAEEARDIIRRHFESLQQDAGESS